MKYKIKDKREIINKTKEYARTKLENESTGHDWWHTFRVWKNAVRIGRIEGRVNLFVIELAALLHDIADWKFNKGDVLVGPRLAKKWLKKLKVKEDVIKNVCEIIKNISFKGIRVKSKMKTKEGMIVQDADTGLTL